MGDHFKQLGFDPDDPLLAAVQERTKSQTDLKTFDVMISYKYAMRLNPMIFSVLPSWMLSDVGITSF